MNPTDQPPGGENTKGPKLTEPQRIALHLAADDVLFRWRGGFWAPAAEPDKYRGGHPRGQRVPERHTTIRTVDVLVSKGLLERCHLCEAGILLEEWRDPRKITDAGRSALSQVGR